MNNDTMHNTVTVDVGGRLYYVTLIDDVYRVQWCNSVGKAQDLHCGDLRYHAVLRLMNQTN